VRRSSGGIREIRQVHATPSNHDVVLAKWLSAAAGLSAVRVLQVKHSLPDVQSYNIETLQPTDWFTGRIRCLGPWKDIAATRFGRFARSGGPSWSMLSPQSRQSHEQYPPWPR
jgi:hypothetical protein